MELHHGISLIGHLRSHVGVHIAVSDFDKRCVDYLCTTCARHISEPGCDVCGRPCQSYHGQPQTQVDQSASLHTSDAINIDEICPRMRCVVGDSQENVILFGTVSGEAQSSHPCNRL